MNTFDSQNRLPLWRQVHADLRSRLSHGEFDDHFPSDREIVETYKISRHTAREAVKSLTAEGLLIRNSGRGGTKIRPIKFRQPLGAIYSLFRAIENEGVLQQSQVIVFDIRSDPEHARRLNLARDAELVYLERLRFADGVPLAHDKSWLPESLARPILSSDMKHTALYEELAKKCGIIIDGGEEQISPINMSTGDAFLLEIPILAPAFAIRRLASAEGQLVESRETVIRGDRYCFSVSWSNALSRQSVDWGRNSEAN